MIEPIYTRFGDILFAQVFFNAEIASNFLQASILVMLISPLLLIPRRKIESELFGIQEIRTLVIQQLAENLSHFEKSSDRLRNPLAVILGTLELREEIEKEKVMRIINQHAVRIKDELDELRNAEEKTHKLFEEIYEENKFQDKNEKLLT